MGFKIGFKSSMSGYAEGENSVIRPLDKAGCPGMMFMGHFSKNQFCIFPNVSPALA